MKKITGLYIGILIIINTAYLGLELYKNTVRDRWAADEGIVEEAYHQLQQLMGITGFLEVLLVLVILVGALGIVFCKKKELLKTQVIITLGISVLFLAGAFVAGLVFDAPRGNLYQQIHSMNGAIALILTYRFITGFLRKREMAGTPGN